MTAASTGTTNSATSRRSMGSADVLAGGGAVRAVGRANAGRIHVRAEARGQPAPYRRRVRVARAHARRPAGTDARVAQERARRGDDRADPRLSRSRLPGG